MPNPIFAVPLNMGTGTWVVTIIAGLGFVVMFGISSAFGDFQGLVNTTLENDSIAREKKKKVGKHYFNRTLVFKKFIFYFKSN